MQQKHSIMQFLLTRPLRDVTKDSNLRPCLLIFLLTRPLRDVTRSCLPPSGRRINFYSHAPYGTWQHQHRWLTAEMDFYSHAPYGTWQVTAPFTNRCRPISTHTPLTGRDPPYAETQNYVSISTHTPLTGRDGSDRPCPGCQNISTHTPLTGRDVSSQTWHFYWNYFYSHAPYGTWRKNWKSCSIYIQFLLTRPLRDVTEKHQNF